MLVIVKKISKSFLNILTTDLDGSVLIQDFIKVKEFGVNVFNDFDGFNLVTVVK